MGLQAHIIIVSIISWDRSGPRGVFSPTKRNHVLEYEPAEAVRLI